MFDKTAQLNRPVFPSASETPPKPQQSNRSHAGNLSFGESVLAFVVFVTWLVLFAAGILIDTRPFRNEISPTGVVALEAGAPQSENITNTPDKVQPSAPQPIRNPNLAGEIISWTVVVFCFTPLNLVWICAVSSILGTFGARARLGDDTTKASQDSSSPYVSALLRGLFVYHYIVRFAAEDSAEN